MEANYNEIYGCPFVNNEYRYEYRQTQLHSNIYDEKENNINILKDLHDVMEKIIGKSYNIDGFPIKNEIGPSFKD